MLSMNNVGTYQGTELTSKRERETYRHTDRQTEKDRNREMRETEKGRRDREIATSRSCFGVAFFHFKALRAF